MIGEKLSPGLPAAVFSTALLMAPPETEGGVGSRSRPTTESETVLRAIRVLEPPKLDGVLDEQLWKEAPVFDRFIQMVPDEGKRATERTEVRIVYTRNKLYFGVACFQTEPDKIIANELRYDQARMYAQDDTFAIILDTFHDHRNGYLFIINPLGARNEWACTDEGRNWNLYWDAVWDVAARMGAEGWSAEVEIPFKSLRYRGGGGPWGINLRRAVLHKNEWVHATPIPASYKPAANGIGKLSSAALLEGLEGISESRNLELKPYAAVESRATVSGDEATRGAFQPGIDIKYGFTPNLNLDLTWNTDFSQVEVDDQQINLTRFGLFFPEKRTFFQEGRGIFDFGIDRGNYRVLPFFSRRIGLEQDLPVPIRGGGRLTGKAGPYSVGFLSLRTAGETVHPPTSFSVVRLKRDILQRSTVGFLWTDRRPGSSGTANAVIGVDANLAFLAKSKVDLYWLRSSLDTPGANSSAHRAHLLLESDLLGFETDWMRVGDAFNPEVGFVQRDDMERRFVKLQVSPRPRRLGMRKVFFTSSLDYVNNLRGLLETRTFEEGVEVEFDTADVLSLVWQRSYEALEQSFRVAGVLQIPSGSYRFDQWSLNLSTAPSRNLSASANLREGHFFDGTRRDFGIASILKVNPHLFFDLNYFTTNIRILAGDLHTHLLGLRTNVALNTRLFGAALIQWNSITREFGVNARLRYTYRPGSDLYIVFNERMERPADSWFLRERSLILKWTYLLRV